MDFRKNFIMCTVIGSAFSMIDSEVTKNNQNSFILVQS